MILRDMPAIDAAINAESFDWLFDNIPHLAEAVAYEVKAGARPDEIRRHVMKQTQRDRLAARCEQAADHMVSENEGS